MAAKQMEYTGNEPLRVSTPDGKVAEVSKGDVVSFDGWGGDGFFAGRSDFKVKKAASPKGKGS